MITNELANQSIDYILRHLDEEISIEDVADHCHFSKYYFREFSRKMEQSAV